MYGHMGDPRRGGGVQQVAPAILRLIGYVDVTDHGIVEGGTVGTAASNTAALNTLIAAEANSRRFFFPPGGSYSFNPGTNIDHNVGSGAPKHITLCGVNGQSGLILWGTAGPWFSFGTNSASPLFGGGMEDLLIYHGDVAASGATIAIGNIVSGPGLFELNNIRFAQGDAPGKAPIAAIQNGIGAFGGGFHMQDSKIVLRTDTLVNPAGIVIANTASTSAIRIQNVGIDGETGRSDGILFSNSGAIDTMHCDQVSLKDHKHALRIAGTCTANVENVFWTDCILDVCSDYNILAQPGTGSTLGTWNWQGTWMSCQGTNVHLDASNGGLVSGWDFSGGSTHNATGRIFNLDGCTYIGISSRNLGSSIVAAGAVCVEIGNADKVALVGSIVSAGNTTPDGVVRIAATADPVSVVGNTLIGGADADGIIDAGAGSASRVIANNAYRAS